MNNLLNMQLSKQVDVGKRFVEFIKLLYLEDENAVDQGLRGNKIPQLEQPHSYPRGGIGFEIDVSLEIKFYYLFP